MKVLHIYKTYYPESIGGIEKVIDSLSYQLQKHQVISDVLTITNEKKNHEKLWRSQKIYCYKKTFCFQSCPASFSMFKAFKKIIKNYDILHYHFPWPFVDLMHVMHKIRIPTVLTYHSDIVKQKKSNFFYRPLMYRFFDKINAIVTTSPNLEKTSQALKLFRQKVKVIPIGISRDHYPPSSKTLLEYWRKRIGENFFLFIGVLRYYKGLNFLLEAVKNTSIPLVIVGVGPEELQLKKFVQQHHMSNVIFLGGINEKNKIALIQLAKVIVAPAHLPSEAFCIALLEGLLFKKPLISTEIGTGTSFVNKHNFCGLVVPPKNPNALRPAMLKLLSDKKLYLRLQNGCEKHYNSYFIGENVALQYKALYRILYC